MNWYAFDGQALDVRLSKHTMTLVNGKLLIIGSNVNAAKQNEAAEAEEAARQAAAQAQAHARAEAAAALAAQQQAQVQQDNQSSLAASSSSSSSSLSRLSNNNNNKKNGSALKKKKRGGASSKRGGKTRQMQMYIFDTETMHWAVKRATGDGPVESLKSHSSTLMSNGRVVVFGGGDDGETYFNEVYVLDTLRMHWTKARCEASKSDDGVPVPRRGHTAIACGPASSHMLVFGGGCAGGKAPTNELWMLDIESMRWSKLGTSKGHAPSARGHHGAGMIGGKKLYVFGGTDTVDVFGDMVVFDLATESWFKKRLPAAPSSRCRFGHSLSVVGSWLFMFGGHNGAEYTNDLAILNLEDLRWKDVTVSGASPAPRAFHQAAYHDSRLFISGGQDDQQQFNDLHILDLGTYAWL
jgi:Kelch motif/Galactose oxidase, central domain